MSINTEEILYERIDKLKKALGFISGCLNKEKSGMYLDMPELNYIGWSLDRIKEAYKEDKELEE